MDFALPHIANRLFNTPLMYDARKGHVIAAAIGRRVAGMPVDVVGPGVDHVAFTGGRPSMGIVGDRLGRAIMAEGAQDELLDHIVDGVAVIAIEGTLVHKGAFVGSFSGDTSYQGLQSQIRHAHTRQDVRGVVFEVDSFGGEVAGAFDTAAMIADLSAEKPTIAILTDYALSAGYLLASAARQIVMPETGWAGSIGVITLHADMSAALEKDGLRVTVLSSGAHKADGNPFAPLPAPVADKIRADLAATRDLFAETVARHRGPRLTKAAALATEAQVYTGPNAVAAGLADAVMRPSEAFAAFVDAVGTRGARLSAGR